MNNYDAADPSPLAAALVAILRPVLGPVTVGPVERLKGGYSREMWSFDAWAAEAPSRPLILCTDSAVSVVSSHEAGLDRVREAALLHTLHTAGLPVPDAIASGPARGPLGRPFFVMERRPGTAAIAPLHHDPWYVEHRDQLTRQFAAMLAAIHRAEVGDAILGRRPTSDEVAPQALARWAAELAATDGARTPTLDRAVVWLGAHLPPAPPRVTLVHGDYRTGNILHGRGGSEPDGLQVVLDWELAHFGDPLEDVAWAQLVCWRVGTDRVGGLATLEEWSAAYGAATGVPVDAVRLRFWEVLASVKMAALMWRAARTVTAGAERALLERLFKDLGDELDRRLLVDR